MRWRLGFGVVQQIAHNLVDTIHFMKHIAEDLAMDVACGNGISNHLDGAFDSCERVFDLMSQSGRQRSEGRQMRRICKLALHTPKRRHVLEH